MSDPVSNPYAAPSAPASPDPFPTASGPILAGRFTRFAAAIVDGLIVMAIVVPVQIMTGFTGRVMAGEASLVEQLVMSGFGMIAFLVPHGYLLLTRGQTIGKMLTRIRIVDHDTEELLPPMRVYVARYLWTLPFVLAVIVIPGPSDDMLVNVLILIDVLLIFGASRRCIHDYLAGSKVVQVD